MTDKLTELKKQAEAAQNAYSQELAAKEKAEADKQARIDKALMALREERAKNVSKAGEAKRIAYQELMTALTTGAPDPYPLWAKYARAHTAFNLEKQHAADLQGLKRQAQIDHWKSVLKPLNDELFYLDTIKDGDKKAPVRNAPWSGKPLPNREPNLTVRARIAEINKQINEYRQEMGQPARELDSCRKELVDDYIHIPKPSISQEVPNDPLTFIECVNIASQQFFKEAKDAHLKSQEQIRQQTIKEALKETE